MTRARAAEILGRLVDAVYRHDPAEAEAGGVRPHLAGERHQLLRTAYGDLDCLGTIDAGSSYDDLLPQTVEMRLADGRPIRVLSLPQPAGERTAP